MAKFKIEVAAAKSKTCEDFSHEYPIAAPAIVAAVFRNFLLEDFIFSFPMVDVDCDIQYNSYQHYVYSDQSDLLCSFAFQH